MRKTEKQKLILGTKPHAETQDDSKLEVQTLRGDRARHKDSQMHRKTCPQASF